MPQTCMAHLAHTRVAHHTDHTQTHVPPATRASLLSPRLSGYSRAGWLLLPLLQSRDTPLPLPLPLRLTEHCCSEGRSPPASLPPPEACAWGAHGVCLCAGVACVWGVPVRGECLCVGVALGVPVRGGCLCAGCARRHNRCIGVHACPLLLGCFSWPDHAG